MQKERNVAENEPHGERCSDVMSLSSCVQDCPFIVCMTYAFHTPDKLCFILDLMNGELTPTLPASAKSSSESILRQNDWITVAGCSGHFSPREKALMGFGPRQ